MKNRRTLIVVSVIIGFLLLSFLTQPSGSYEAPLQVLKWIGLTVLGLILTALLIVAVVFLYRRYKGKVGRNLIPSFSTLGKIAVAIIVIPFIALCCANVMSGVLTIAEEIRWEPDYRNYRICFTADSQGTLSKWDDCGFCNIWLKEGGLTLDYWQVLTRNGFGELRDNISETGSVVVLARESTEEGDPLFHYDQSLPITLTREFEMVRVEKIGGTMKCPALVETRGRLGSKRFKCQGTLENGMGIAIFPFKS